MALISLSLCNRLSGNRTIFGIRLRGSVCVPCGGVCTVYTSLGVTPTVDEKKVDRERERERGTRRLIQEPWIKKRHHHRDVL